MQLKLTPIGMCIYAAILLYFAAFLCHVFGRRRQGRIWFSAGFAVALSAFFLRALETGRVPLQSMFEVFLAMGVAVWPLALVLRRLAPRASESVEPLLGALVLAPAGFVFDAAPQQLPPALRHWIFGPHVAVYLAGYICMFKAGAIALKILIAWPRAPETAAAEEEMWRTARFGFQFITLGLALGAWWGKLAWGDYWNWDPKEMWALAMWLIYVAYFHFRAATRAGYPRANAVFALAGCCAILCTLLWVNLARIFSGLHTYAS